MVTRKSIRDRLIGEFLASRLIENNLRGYWCEAMVAEALGSECKVVSGGWNAWDLQFGPDEAEFPDRIRIQVKNSAKLQTWNANTGKLSQPIFDLRYSRRPSYFERDSAGIPCEEVGFLCDIFILCFHPEENKEVADHRDPHQWCFYVLPVVGKNSAVTDSELTNLQRKFEIDGKPKKTQRRPGTLEEGQRGRPKIFPLGIADLTTKRIRSAIFD